jgi:hypothetical protein
MSTPQYCSRCGKRIAGACQKCRDEILADLERRRAIEPGRPTINGEYRDVDFYKKPTDIIRGEHRRKAAHIDPEESGSSFDRITRAYEDE